MNFKKFYDANNEIVCGNGKRLCVLGDNIAMGPRGGFYTYYNFDGNICAYKLPQRKALRRLCDEFGHCGGIPACFD